MHALLLLAGRSRRFWPLSEKSLWPFCGKPLLQHQIERLQAGGCTKITFVGGAHNLEEVHQLFPNMPAIEQEDLTLGMRGALLSALPELGKDPVCIVSGNDVIDPDGYSALFAAASEANIDAAILAQRVRSYFPGGYLLTSTNDDGGLPRVAGIVEKPGFGKEPSDLVNIVAHVFRHPQQLLELLEETSSDRDDAYEVALTKLCATQHVVAVPYEGRWSALKYPWHVLDLTDRFLAELSGGELDAGECEGARSNCHIHPSAVVEGAVILEEGVKILPHASVIGPCTIGKGTIIGNNCLVRQSIIGEQCVIGFGSEIARSNLHSHVWTHSTYLGDSVIGHNVAFGAGSTTANFRLDEGEIASFVSEQKLTTGRKKLGLLCGNNVRCGVQTVFAPGVKIGAGSFINSAVSVTEDVAENKFVTVKDGVLEQRENLQSAPGVRGERG